MACLLTCLLVRGVPALEIAISLILCGKVMPHPVLHRQIAIKDSIHKIK